MRQPAFDVTICASLLLSLPAVLGALGCGGGSGSGAGGDGDQGAVAPGPAYTVTDGSDLPKPAAADGFQIETPGLRRQATPTRRT